MKASIQPQRTVRAAEGLRRSVDEFAALYEASRDLSAQTSVASLLRTVMERASTLLGSSSTTVFLYDLATQQVEVAATVGGTLQIGTRFGFSDGVTGRVAQTGQPILIEDYQTWEHRIPEMAAHGVRAVLMVPMACGGELIGALGVSEYTAARTYTEDDERLLSLFAALAAGSLRTVQLLEDERRRAILLLLDNAERRRIENDLRESEARYRQLIELSPDGIGVHCNGEIVYINSAGVRLIGAEDASQLLGHSVFEFVHPDDLAGVLTRVQSMLTQGTSVANVEWRMVRLDGTVRIVEAAGMPLQHAGDGAIQVVVRDITSRKAAEEALRASEERYRELVENAHDLVYVHDLAGNFIAINRAAEEAIGYSREEALTRNIADIVAPEHLPHAMELMIGVAQGQDPPASFEADVITKDGRRITLEISARPVFRGGATVAVQGVARDVTERNRAAEEIRALNDALEQRVVERTAELEAANEELEAFGYSVSHDLRGPLRVIEGFSRLLMDEYGEVLDDAGRKYVERVQASSQRMAQLIQDLLNLSRITRNAIQRRRIDLGVLARTVANDLCLSDPERSVEFVIAPRAPATGDPSMLRILVENLLGNAWKYTGKHASARIEFGVRLQAGETVYFVRDDGAGFDMEYVGKLFHPFQRLHLVSEFDGTGIGLATVERIVRRHGGRVWAESTVEGGATFYFTLAAVRAEPS